MNENVGHRQDGATIRRLRQERGIKAAQLAERVGVTRDGLSHVEAGHQQASVELLYRIGRELNVEIGVILSDRGRDELGVSA